jgi:hypothetical protein
MIIADLLQDLSYKPKWTFSVFAGRLWIVAEVPNTRGSGTTQVKGDWELPDITDRAQALLWVRGRIAEVELHEMDEAIHLNARRIFDPHDAARSVTRQVSRIGGSPPPGDDGGGDDGTGGASSGSRVRLARSRYFGR